MATEKDVLELQLGVDVKKAVEDVKRLRENSKQSFRDMSRVSQFFGKGIRKFVLDPVSRISTGVQKATDTYTKYGKTVEKYNALISRAQKKLVKANDGERQQFKEDIAKYKKFRDDFLKDFKKQHGGPMSGVAKAAHAGLAGAAKGARRGAGAANVGVGDVITSALGVGGALLRKDLEGAVEGAVHTLTKPFLVGAHVIDKTVGKVFKKTGGFFWKTGDKSFAKAKKMWGKGGAGGVAGAGGMAVLGTASKALGGLGQTIGAMTKSLTMIGASMGSVASAAGLIIKLFMGMEEQAKGFNKEVLQTADTSQLLYANGMDADKAYKSLNGTLDKMRDDAYDIGENLQWGITAKEHQAFEQTLFQEGVDLRTMKKEFRDAQTAAHGMTGEVQGWGDAVHVAVAFSRNWGVSLQEITQFQAEAMRDIGQSFDSTMLSMAKMSRGAAESGIATNKFFAIIRGVSADLNLYNTRIDQATSLLKLMGKYMNPREAQKYMSTLVGMYKQMSEEDRIRQVMLMGVDKAQKIVLDDLKDKTDNLGVEIQKQTGISAKDFQDAMANSAKDGGKAIEAIMKQAGDNLKGSQREAIVALEMDYKRVQKGGAVGIAEAMQNLSAAGAVTATKAALQRFGGGKKLSDMIGLQAFAARKAAGVSQEQFDQAVKLEKAIDSQRDAMVEALKNPQDPKNADLLKRMSDLGITTENVGKTSDQKVIAAMDQDQQRSMTDSQKEINWAKKQTKLTQTLSDKVGTIIDGIFNYLYQALKDVVDTIDEFFEFISEHWPGGAKDDARKDRREQIKSLSQNGDRLSKDLVDALRQGSVMKSVTDAVNSNVKSSADIQDTLQSVLSTMTTEQEQNAAKMLKGLDPKKSDEMLKAMQDGKGLLGALNKAGFTPDEMKNVIGQLLGGLTEKQVVRAATQMQSLKGGLGSIAPAGAMKSEVDEDLADQPSGQQQASINAGGPTAPPAPTPATSAAPSLAAPAPPPGAVSPAHAAATAAAATDLSPMTDDQGDQLLTGIQGLQQVLWQKGIKINKSFLRDQFWKNGEDAILDATRTSLFEYFLYSKMDSATVAAGLKDGKVNALTFGQKFAEQVAQTGDIPTTLQGFAMGGIIPEPKSPDQVFVAARPGEQVVPPGGGRGGDVTIPININGVGGQELANMMRAAALSVYAEWKRKQKFT